MPPAWPAIARSASSRRAGAARAPGCVAGTRTRSSWGCFAGIGRATAPDRLAGRRPGHHSDGGSVRDLCRTRLTDDRHADLTGIGELVLDLLGDLAGNDRSREVVDLGGLH